MKIFYKILIFKKYGLWSFSENFRNLMKNYLSNRSSIVNFNESNSNKELDSLKLFEPNCSTKFNVHVILTRKLKKSFFLMTRCFLLPDIICLNCHLYFNLSLNLFLNVLNITVYWTSINQMQWFSNENIKDKWCSQHQYRFSISQEIKCICEWISFVNKFTLLGTVLDEYLTFEFIHVLIYFLLIYF